MTTRVLLWDLGTSRSEQNEPIGICMIAAEAAKRHLPVRLDLKWTTADYRFSNEDITEYDIIGVSARIGTYDLLQKIYAAFQPDKQKRILVAGDAIPTYAPTELLMEMSNIVCVIGEGESTFSDLIERFLARNGDSEIAFEQIPNLAFLHGSEVVLTPRRSERLELLPEPSRAFVSGLVDSGGIIRIEGSRGCAFSDCSFCCVRHRYGDGEWRPFPTEYIVSQLKEIARHGGRSPYFTDEDFIGGNADRVVFLCNEICSQKESGSLPADMNFFVSLSVRDIVRPAHLTMLQAMAKAGFREVFLGLESGSSEQLRRYNKPATPDSNRRALSIVATHGMEVDIGFILFDPEMTFAELEVCADYIGSIEIDRHDARSLKSLRIQPCTSLADQYRERGIVTGPLDIDSLAFPYRFLDPRVAEVHSLFRAFEAEHEREVYRIQADSRGEVADSNDRLTAKETLSAIRHLDYSYLVAVIDQYSGRTGQGAAAESRRILSDHKRRVLDAYATTRDESRHSGESQ